MFLRRKQSGRLNKPASSRSVFNGTLVILLSLCILLGLFGWKNAVAVDYSCDLEEHTHSEECYEKTLICDNEDSEHGHTDDCHTQTLICGKEEHTHTDDCLTSAEPEETIEQQEEETEENGIMAFALDNDSGISDQADSKAPPIIKGTTPPNTVINLFDYWVTDTDYPSEDSYPNTTYGGINQRVHNSNVSSYDADYDRPLIFRAWDNQADGDANKYTNSYNPKQGIVQNLLGKDGYPLINWENSSYWPSAFIDGTSTTTAAKLQSENASLAYLFDSSSYPKTLGKLAYSDVDGLFQVDSQGYYYYDCTENYACYDSNTNSFELYKGSANLGQFFPFAPYEIAESVNGSTNQAKLNHYFGLTMTTRFVQDYGGHISTGTDANEMIFDFSGDDDVWIFIDDVLVSDLGGIHQSSGTTINFATGVITYYNPDTKAVYGTTSLREQFDAAYDDGTVASWAADKKGWTQTDNGSYIFSDDTSHTLKFFYLERGNDQSNMKLKTNLLQIPETSITKVDQYGNPMGDVPLAIYQATATDETKSSTYYFVDDTGNYKILPSSITNDMVNPTTGVITTEVTTDSGAKVTVQINPKLKGSTNSVTYDSNGNVVSGSGEWVLKDDDGIPYTSEDLKDKLKGSNQMIAREISVPDGYRTVSDNILLYFDKGEHLTTPNAYESGVWPSPNVLVTATNTLYDTNGNSISYYDAANNTSTGTLFAVVLKRNGASLSDFEDTWYPIYGDETNGYTVEDQPGLSSVLTAYKQNVKNYSDPTFKATSAGMQVLLTDLPGSLSRYYTYMLDHKIPMEENGTEPQYAVAYFYSPLSQENLLEVSPENAASNIVRVASHAGVGYVPNSYTGFLTKWSATIEITNIENRLYYQKYDEQENPVNGATFALYNVTENNGEVYFPSDNGQYEVLLEDDEDLDNKGTAIIREVNSTDDTLKITGTYQINTTSGNDIPLGGITVTAEGIGNITISPATNAETDASGNKISLVGTTQASAIQGANTGDNGTGYFTKLLDGKYILREIDAPEGYKLNTSLIKVLVNEDGVYANAGTADDGVIVGNGAGFLIPTFSDCASHNDIDETLTWIYSLLRVNTSNDSYDALKSLNVLYSPDNGTLGSEEKWLYASSEDASDGLSTKTTGTRSQAMVTYLEYGDKAEDDTHKIFDYIVNTVMKTIDGKEVNIAQLARNASTIDYTNAYPTTDGQGTLRLYTDVGWSELSILQDYEWGRTQRSQIGINNSTTYTDLTNQNVYGATGVNMNLTHLFSNSTFVRVTDPRPIDVQLTKVDPTKEASQKYLTGAEFILYQETGQDENGNSINQYYNYDSTNGTTWVSAQDQASTIKFDGRTQSVNDLISGTYYLKETKAPSGYVIETQPWKMVLTETELAETGEPEGAIGKATVELYNPGSTDVSHTVTVYILPDGTNITYSQQLVLELENTKIYNLPSSGSFGVLPFILAGSLILGFSVYLLIREERQAKA